MIQTIFLYVQSRRGQGVLNALPPLGDELVMLPLPFVSTMIADSYWHNQAATRQKINYYIHSTNQQKTAQEAITQIAAESCRRCQTAHDIVAVRQQLAWIQADADTNPLIKICFDISHDIQTALNATSPYRQSEEIGQTAQEVTRYRNGLATVATRDANRFSAIFDQWIVILKTAERTLSEEAKKKGEVPQVYLAGVVLDAQKAKELFKGRIDLFRDLESLLLSAQRPTFLLYGGRRTGKTSTLNYLPQNLPTRIIPLLVDMQGMATATTLDGFVTLTGNQIITSAKKVRGLTLPVLDDERIKRDPLVGFYYWMDRVEEQLANKTILLCIDEYERLDEVVQDTGNRALLNFLRHLIQHRPKWTLLFSGSHQIDELPAYWSDYLINTYALKISTLPYEDTVELIVRPIKGFPSIYSAEAVQAIWEMTQGQPYLVQLICYELVNALNAQRRSGVTDNLLTSADVEAVIPKVFERGQNYFREFWYDNCSAAEQAVLSAIIQEKKPASTEHVARLIKKEVLKFDETGVRFHVPLLARWIRGKIEHG